MSEFPDLLVKKRDSRVQMSGNLGAICLPGEYCIKQQYGKSLQRLELLLAGELGYVDFRFPQRGQHLEREGERKRPPPDLVNQDLVVDVNAVFAQAISQVSVGERLLLPVLGVDDHLAHESLVIRVQG